MELEFNPMAFILAAVATIIGLIVAKNMAAGLFFRLIIAGICGVVGYFVALAMSNN